MFQTSAPAATKAWASTGKRHRETKNGWCDFTGNPKKKQLVHGASVTSVSVICFFFLMFLGEVSTCYDSRLKFCGCQWPWHIVLFTEAVGTLVFSSWLFKPHDIWMLQNKTIRTPRSIGMAEVSFKCFNK